jgi:hypothetical protein
VLDFGCRFAIMYASKFDHQILTLRQVTNCSFQTWRGGLRLLRLYGFHKLRPYGFHKPRLVRFTRGLASANPTDILSSNFSPLTTSRSHCL